MNRIYQTNCFNVASSLVLLAFLFGFQCAFAQIPAFFLQFIEKQNTVKSGYVKLQHIYMKDNDTTDNRIEEGFFISTDGDFKYLVHHQTPSDSNTFCKSAHTLVAQFNLNDYDEQEYIKYWCNDKIEDAKRDEDIYVWYYFSYSSTFRMPFKIWENGIFQRIHPKVDKKNIRYKIMFPDDEMGTNYSQEWEFNKKMLKLIQTELLSFFFNTERNYGREDILEQRLYEYIHPDILDTISFKYEELKKGYDRQQAEEQAKKDSVLRDHLCDSVARLFSDNGAKWIENISQNIQEDTLFFMPEWKFPLLSGDTIYVDSIKSRFLFIDMWYVSCYPCMKAMLELLTIDTLYDESLFKIVSINVADDDTAKINKVTRNLNIKCDIALAYYLGDEELFNLSKKMGMEFCRGYPKLYLVEMKTKQVIWRSCGWYEGFTKEIEEIIKTGDKP